MSFPQATVVIVSKSRRPELRNAIRSSLSQDISTQVLVLDDGSTDGTSDMVRSEFPTVELHTYNRSAGLVVRRNLGAQLAKTPIVVSIDDDAVFSSPSVVRQTLAQFTNDRVGVVAIPFVNVKVGPTVMQIAPDSRRLYAMYGFIGTAHAIRRDVFLGLGGYTEFLFQQGEEDDFAIRLLDAGYIVRVGFGDPIYHFESPKRDFRRMDIYGRRNHVLFAYQRVPMPHTVLHLGRATVRCVLEGMRTRRFLNMSTGLIRGYADAIRHPELRATVKATTYKLWMLLRAEQAVDLASLRDQLPPIIDFGAGARSLRRTETACHVDL